MEFARVDQAESLLSVVRKKNAVADHFAVEIDVGLGDSGDVFEFNW